jgi:hypothetical protein
MRGWLAGLLSAFVVLTGIGLCLQLTRDTPEVGPDGVVYLATAMNIRDGRGVTTPFTFVGDQYTPRRAADFDGAVPLTHFPPAYPLALASGGVLGLDGLDAARVLGCITLAVDLLLFGLLVKRATDAPDWLLPAAAMVLLLVGPAGIQVLGASASLLALSGSVLSESSFVAFTLGALLALARWLDQPDLRWLGLTAGLVAAAVLTRFAGLSLVACIGIAALAWGTGGLGRRIRDAALLVGGSLLPLLAWSVYSSAQGAETARDAAFHPVGGNLSLLLSIGSRWFSPSSIASQPRQIMFAALLVVLAAMMIDLARLRVHDAGRSVRRVLGLFAVSYVIVIELTHLFNSATPLDGRILGPLQPVLYSLALGVLVTWLRARFHFASSLTLGVTGALVIVVALFGVSTTLDDVNDGSVPPRMNARVARAIAAVPRTAPIVTDNSVELWTATARGSLLQPQKFDYTTNEPDPAYADKLRDTLRFLRSGDGVYVRTPSGLYPNATPGAYRFDGTCLRRWKLLGGGWALWRPRRC